MKVVTNIAKMRELSRQARSAGLTVGFVPTMGYLHDGHLELVHRARELADVVVVSIFVNPTQFDRKDDFDAYPRDDKTDQALLAELGVEFLFAPDAAEMYRPNAATGVRVERLTDNLCGSHRAGHFDGVATVVTSLFHIIEPDYAIFGEKDFQQIQVVRRMVRDLHMSVSIVGVDTVRESDGLAMSSRNARLSDADRALAPAVYAGLRAAAQAYVSGERDARLLETAARAVMETAGLKVEYLDLVDGEDLSKIDVADDQSVLAVAAFLGDVRLIDNLCLARGADDAATAMANEQGAQSHA